MLLSLVSVVSHSSLECWLWCDGTPLYCRIKSNERDLMARVHACQQLCMAYSKENHDAKIRYRNIDREINSVRPELMKLQREKNDYIG